MIEVEATRQFTQPIRQIVVMLAISALIGAGGYLAQDLLISIYEANILAQNAEIVGDFYKKLGVPANEIKELKDDFYYPTTKYKIRKAGGGPVGPSGVDQYKKGGRIYGKYASQIAKL